MDGYFSIIGPFSSIKKTLCMLTNGVKSVSPQKRLKTLRTHFIQFEPVLLSRCEQYVSPVEKADYVCCWVK